MFLLRLLVKVRLLAVTSLIVAPSGLEAIKTLVAPFKVIEDWFTLTVLVELPVPDHSALSVIGVTQASPAVVQVAELTLATAVTPAIGVDTPTPSMLPKLARV